MKLTSKFGLRSESPMAGGLSGHWMTMTPVEVNDAYATGTGPGTPDTDGTITPGTVVGGMIVTPDSSGLAALMTSPTLNSAGIPLLPYVVFSGDDDFSGAMSGVVIAVHGPGRLDTDQFVGSSGYTPGVMLVATAGKWDIKVGSDNKQVVGWVGPRGLDNGVLDVIAVQGINNFVG